MYDIYETEGIILSSGDIGEANKIINIFTQDLGLLSATAQSLRQIKSKLRFGLQNFTLANISLVRGRDVWRITNVEYKKNFYKTFFKDKNKMVVVANLGLLLRKILAGETPDQKLYDTILVAFSFLEREKLSLDEIKDFESVLVVKILYILGYFDKHKQIKNQKIYEQVINQEVWDKSLLEKIRLFNGQIIKDINEAFYATHLF
ncbi:MAG: DNA repair protein RecO [Patescibacteria group bacterium]